MSKLKQKENSIKPLFYKATFKQVTLVQTGFSRITILNHFNIYIVCAC